MAGYRITNSVAESNRPNTDPRCAPHPALPCPLRLGSFSIIWLGCKSLRA